MRRSAFYRNCPISIFVIIRKITNIVINGHKKRLKTGFWPDLHVKNAYYFLKKTPCVIGLRFALILRHHINKNLDLSVSYKYNWLDAKYAF